MLHTTPNNVYTRPSVRHKRLTKQRQSLVWRLFPGRFGDEASFLPRLWELAEAAPSVLVLEEPADGGGGVEDEFLAAEPQPEVRRWLRGKKKREDARRRASYLACLKTFYAAFVEWYFGDGDAVVVVVVVVGATERLNQVKALFTRLG